MVTIKYLAPFVQKVVLCINDTKPDNIVIEEDWIKKGQYYLLRGLVDTAINQSNDSVYLLSDMSGNPIRVSDSVKGYRSTRFVDVDVLTLWFN